MKDIGDTILTPDQVANLKEVTRSAVYAAIAQERLPHVRVLGRLGVKSADAKAWHPLRWIGRPKGIPMSTDAKKRISSSQKRRWSYRKRSAKAQ